MEVLHHGMDKESIMGPTKWIRIMKCREKEGEISVVGQDSN